MNGKYNKVLRNRQVNQGKKKRVRKDESDESTRKHGTHDVDRSSLTDTPFSPRMREHAAVLSKMQFAAQREDFIQQLHRTYGSKYVQRLMTFKDIQRQTPEEDEELLQGKLDIQRQVPEEEEEIQMLSNEITPVTDSIKMSADGNSNRLYTIIQSEETLDTIQRRPGDSANVDNFLYDHPGHGDLVKDINDGMSEFDVVDTLLRNFLYRSDFQYTGQRAAFWSHMGDCFVLCSEFFIICRDYFNIALNPKQTNLPLFVPGPSKQAGDVRTGNADSGRAWIYDEHFWLEYKGSPLDVLFGHWGIGHFPGLKGVDGDGCEFYYFNGPDKRRYYFNREAKDLSDVYTSSPAKKARNSGEVPAR